MKVQIRPPLVVALSEPDQKSDECQGNSVLSAGGSDDRDRPAHTVSEGSIATQLISTNASGRISSVTPTAVQAG